LQYSLQSAPVLHRYCTAPILPRIITNIPYGLVLDGTGSAQE
jgi:hypothetical protein